MLALSGVTPTVWREMHDMPLQLKFFNFFLVLLLLLIQGVATFCLLVGCDTSSVDGDA